MQESPVERRRPDAAAADMVEETARRCGHLDLLRESIDGMTGR